MSIDLVGIRERAEQAVALDNEASPGPWLLEHGKYSGANWLLGTVMCGTGFDDQEHYVHITTDSVKSDELSDAADDAEFIAASRTAVPALAVDVLSLAALYTASQAALTEALAELTAARAEIAYLNELMGTV